MGFDYRGGGTPFDTSLPLPRRAMLPWTIIIPIVGFFMLFFPWITIGVSVNRSYEFSRFFKEAGLSSLFIVFLFVLSTIAVTVLGVFIARGKRIPGTILLGLSLFPVLVSVLGSFYHQSRITRIVEGGESSSIGLSSALRIGATGYAEIDALIIIGSLTSACLCFLSAMATIASVLTVNSRKLDEASQPDPSNQGPARRSSLWLVGAGVGALLFLIIAGVHLGVGWKWSGGMPPKLGVIVFFLAALAAGPVFGIIRSVVTAVGRDRDEPLDAVGGRSPVATTSDLRRVAGAAVLSAVLVAFAVFLFDRATFAFSDRAVLRGLVGADYSDYSGLSPYATSLLGGTSLLGLAALGIRPSSVNLLVDTIAAMVLFAPALALALRRPSWVTVGVTGGLSFVVVVALAGWSLSRSSNFSTFAEINNRHSGQLPAEMVSLNKKNSSYSSYSSSSRADVNLTVSAAGEVKEILSPSYYADDVGIAPDKNTSLIALVDAAARPRSRSSYSSSSSSSFTAGRARVRLIGKTANAEVPPGLDGYRAFIQLPTTQYDIEMHLVKPKPPGAIVTSADAALALGGSSWGTPAVSSTSVLWVYATSPDAAKITCMTSREVFASEIALNDPEIAESNVQKLKEQCGLVTIIAVVPLENAKAEDVFKMVAAMPAQGSAYLSTTLRPVVTADRAAATAWIEKNPVGLRPQESSPWGSGLGAFDRWSNSSSSSSSAGNIRNGSTTVNGRLPPETIQRVVRANNPRYRRCYEQGLQKDPKLTGRVTVKFVIGRDGSVTSAQDGGSDIGDPTVTSCVVRVFSSLRFPEPEGGIVTVTYPLVFSPQ